MAREREQIMLAYTFDDRRLEKWFNQTKKVFIQPKYEGDRCRAVIDQWGKVTLFSSSARVLESVPHINKALEALNLTGMELDGELYKHGMPHEEIRSRVSRTVGLHPHYEDIEYHIYDMVLPLSQITRFELLGQLKPLGPVIKAPTYDVGNEFEMEYIYERLLQEGYEGIILRHPKAPYERKKTIYMMKLKPRLSGIYKVVGGEEEFTIKGERKNALGTLLLQDEDGRTFEVGTGFTRKQREEFWQIREKLTGRMVKIRYQSLTVNKVPKMASFQEFVKSEMTDTTEGI